MHAYSVPCWLVGWWLWRAGCISQDTYLLYNYIFVDLVFSYLSLSSRLKIIDAGIDIGKMGREQ